MGYCDEQLGFAEAPTPTPKPNTSNQGLSECRGLGGHGDVRSVDGDGRERDGRRLWRAARALARLLAAAGAQLSWAHMCADWRKNELSLSRRALCLKAVTESSYSL